MLYAKSLYIQLRTRPVKILEQTNLEAVKFNKYIHFFDKKNNLKPINKLLTLARYPIKMYLFPLLIDNNKSIVAAKYLSTKHCHD